MARKRFLGLCAVATIFGLIFILGFGQIATRATQSDVGTLAGNEQTFNLKTKDNVRIAASFFPVKSITAPVILMLHGNGASRNQFKSHAAWLNAAGYAAMAIDFRGHGESQAESKSFGLREARDVDAALLWIKQNQPNSKVGVIGVSLGGAASLLGKRRPAPFDALVLKAVYPDIDRAIRNRIAARIGGFFAAIGTPLLTWQSPLLFGVSPAKISPINAARTIASPVMVIGGAEDVYTPINESKALYDAFPGQKSLLIVRGLAHDQLSDLDDAVYRTRVLSFFKAHLR